MKLIADLPPSVPVFEVIGALRQLGLEVRYRDRNLIAYPVSPERHGNSNVVPIPRHRGRIVGPRLPEPPEAA